MVMRSFFNSCIMKTTGPYMLSSFYRNEIELQRLQQSSDLGFLPCQQYQPVIHKGDKLPSQKPRCCCNTTKAAGVFAIHWSVTYWNEQNPFGTTNWINEVVSSWNKIHPSYRLYRGYKGDKQRVLSCAENPEASRRFHELSFAPGEQMRSRQSTCGGKASDRIRKLVKKELDKKKKELDW